MQKVKPEVVKNRKADYANPVPIKSTQKDKAPTHRRSKCNSLIHNALKFVFCFCLVIFFICLMFLTTKGSANVSFSSDLTEENDLSLLRSQNISLTSNSLAAHISQYSFLQTKITGETIYLSSDSLTKWIKGYLTDLGVNDCREGYLVVENRQTQCSMGLIFEDDGADASTVRYETISFSETNINEWDTNALSSSAQKLRICPKLVSGEPFGGFVCTNRYITISIPTENGCNLFIEYRSDCGRNKQIQISPEELPEYAYVQEEKEHTFRILDFALQISAEEDGEIQLNILGKFVLDLWAMEVSAINGYLSGTLSFQYTTTPSRYTLNNQFVEALSNKSALNLTLRKGIRVDAKEWDGIESICFDGKVTQMYTSGISLFPGIQMWLRENTYVAPLTLLSAVIAVYNLPLIRSKKE